MNGKDLILPDHRLNRPSDEAIKERCKANTERFLAIRNSLAAIFEADRLEEERIRREASLSFRTIKKFKKFVSLFIEKSC